MRLATLRPLLHWSPTGQGYSHQLEFDCPTCPGERILVNCAIGVSTGTGVWGMTLPATTSGDGWDGFTLVPSISNHHHGRKKTCSCHCSITNGEVLP